MFFEFFRFDLRYHFRSPLMWILGGVFALLAFAAGSSDAVSIGGSIGNIHRNAPTVIVTFLSVFSVIGIFAIAALIAQPLLRDFELGTEELFFSSPMRRSGYVGGRIAAGAVAALIVFLLTALGVMLGPMMPWVDPERLGPFSLAPYGWAFAFVIVPNIVFAAALLSLLAVTTRKLLFVYLGVIGFFVLWTIAGTITQDIRYDTVGGLIDPFGMRAADRAVRYWSAHERNALLPPLTGTFLLNRALWLAIATALFALTLALFRPQRFRSRRFRRNERKLKREATSAVSPMLAPMAATLQTPVFDSRTTWRQLQQQIQFDTAGVLRSVPFLVLLGFGLFNLISGAHFAERLFGTTTYPVTGLLLEAMRSGYSFLLLFIVAYYAGEIIWRERDTRIAAVTDAMPVKSWVPFAAKLGTLFAVIWVFLLVGAVACIAFQLYSGFTAIEPLLYIKGLAIESTRFLLLAVIALVFQVVANHKFLGYLLFIVFVLVQISLSGLHLEHNLYSYAGAPATPYSAMNGYGHFLKGWAWFQLYWALFAALLFVASAAFWVRGIAPEWRRRWRAAVASWHGRTALAMSALAAAFIGVGAWIFYNTNVLNEYVPGDVRMDRQAQYERTYRKYKDLIQPKIVDVVAAVDIYPDERRAVIRGTYHMMNKSGEAIRELHLLLNPTARYTALQLPPAVLETDDAKIGYRIYRLETPIEPGARFDITFAIERHEVGFTSDGASALELGGEFRSPLNYNGTFFNSAEMFPRFGYDEHRQLLDRNERRKRGLGEVPRMAKLEDEAARMAMAIPYSDWISLDTTVSTSADQIAIAPGELVQEWRADGRRYFRYRVHAPMLPYFCYLSADWQVKRSDWRGLPIEVFYDAKHPFNVERMIAATQKSLDYYTQNFSPYPFKQIRILEFPRYAQFAQSFSSTIPFSESIGFVADLRDPEEIDYVFYVTAHEVAHQWWAHQVIGANVQGAAVLTESLAQYSALMVMEKEYGRASMQKFLRYELDRYLRGRGDEPIEELPLLRVENQPYIHYSKGSLVFYRLREEIGEEALNAALAKFIRDKAHQEPPYTTTLELLHYLREVTPPDKQALLTDLFERIVFYDNRIVDASSKRRADGKYEVQIRYSAAKTQSDGKGVETPLPVDDWIEIGVFAGEKDATGQRRALLVERRHITRAADSVTLIGDEPPSEVGIDPFNKLIDRMPDDNRKELRNAGG